MDNETPKYNPEDAGENTPVVESEQEGALPEGAGSSEPAKPGGIKRFLSSIFGADTRTGRVMRPALRTAALITIAFGFGLLAAFFAFYQPLRAQYGKAVGDVAALAEQLNDVNISLTGLEGEKAVMQTTLAYQQSEIERANYQVNFLIVKNDVLRARFALANEESKPGEPTAAAILAELETHLAVLLPYVEADDPTAAGMLTSRVGVVKAELDRDAEQADLDLETLYANLLELEDTLFE